MEVQTQITGGQPWDKLHPVDTGEAQSRKNRYTDKAAQWVAENYPDEWEVEGGGGGRGLRRGTPVNSRTSMLLGLRTQARKTEEIADHHDRALCWRSCSHVTAMTSNKSLPLFFFFLAFFLFLLFFKLSSNFCSFTTVGSKICKE